jgi:formate hydrogenlyase transcriptional activator
MENSNQAISKPKDFYGIEEIFILLKISKEVASVRFKTDLFPIVDTYLKKLFSFDDGVICVVNEDKVTHSAFLYNPEEVFAKYPGCERMAEMKFSTDDGIFNPIINSPGVIVFELQEIAKLPNASVYIPFWIHHGMTQLIGVPLQAGSKSIGSFSFYTKKRNPIPEESFELLHAICSQIAIAIENILINEEIERREREKSVLLSFSNDIVAIRDREGLKNTLKKYLSDLFQINEYIITINNEDDKTYSYLLHDLPVRDPSDKGFKIITGGEMPIAGSLTGAVLKSDEPVIFDIQEIKSNSKYSFPSASFWENADAVQIRGMRLKVADKDIGILWTQPGKINEPLLQGIAAQAAIAIANVIANEKIERQLKEIGEYKVKLEQENSYLLDEVQRNFKYSEIIGSGPEMEKVYMLMSQVAFANSTVLLLGETGTGKELIARAIHDGSSRKKKLMVKVNCAALPANLIESELFGHERGSFTGATERRTGKFELANESTLFLDEIGEMPLDLQVKLLRVLQEKEVERVGGKTTIKVDVRIIAATNRNLQKEVLEGRFRQDLYYRLHVFPITLPPLRNRIEDIPALAKHFIERLSRSTGKKITSISQRALQELSMYNWPGNVRELEHLLERSILLTNGNVIKEIQLPVSERTELMNSVQGDYVKSLEDNERDYIISVLKRCNGKIFGFGGAAERLGVPASTLNSKIIKLNIKKDQLFSDSPKS